MLMTKLLGKDTLLYKDLPNRMSCIVYYCNLHLPET